MKHIAYIFLILLTFLTLDCTSTTNQKKYTEEQKDTEPEDVINVKSPNPFQDYDELLFYQISDSVFHKLKMAYPDHSKWGKLYTEDSLELPLSFMDYVQIDSMARILYSPQNFIHSSDADWEANENGLLEYLNWELWRILKPYIVVESAVNLMEKESNIIDSLIRTQMHWLSKHFNATQQGIGSGYSIKYYLISREMLKIQNKNMQELLQSLTDSSYTYSDLPDIPNSSIKKEYLHILNDLIPYYTNDSVYNADSDRITFLRENQWWEELMSIRREIRKLIRKDDVHAFDSGTYRLRFNRLRQLKNEFEAYELMSPDFRDLTLSDSCSYQELMDYPNFSTLQNEFVEQLNR